MNIFVFFHFLPSSDADLLTTSTKQPIDYRKYRKKLFRRRNSTGSVEVMNSHAVNTGHHHQSVVVGHHRGFSQPSTVNHTTGDPWFLQAHEMPPTAPARHHKRPAPQPGLHNNNISNNNNNVGSQSNHQLSQSQHHHSAVNVSEFKLHTFITL